MIPSQSPRQARQARRVRRVLRNLSRSPDSRSNAPPVFTSSIKLRVIGRAESMNVCIHVVVCRALTNICTLLYSTKRVHCVWSLGMSWD